MATQRKEPRPAKDRNQLYAEFDAAREAWKAGGEVGSLRLSRAAFYIIHTDFRSKRGDKTHPSCLVLATGGTHLIPVQLV